MNDDAAAGPGKIDLDLYKLLKNESANYFDKLQAIWLQKFVLVGGVIAFLVTHYDKLPETGQTLVIHAAVLAVPVLSALLDAKILEFSLHTRAISRFIQTRLSNIDIHADILVEWESTAWGTAGSTEEKRLVGLRSLVTALTAIVPTMLITILAAIALGQLTQRQELWWSLGIVACVVYAAILAVALRLMWPKSRGPSVVT